jgi:hypothetical protein
MRSTPHAAIFDGIFLQRSEHLCQLVSTVRSASIAFYLSGVKEALNGLSVRMWRLLYCTQYFIGYSGYAKWEACWCTVYPIE